MTTADTQTVIREAGSETDRMHLADLARSIWEECFANILSQEQIEYMLGQFQSAEAIGRQMQQGYRYYFILCAGQPAGYFGIQPQQNGKLFLSKLYICAAVRGKGVGSAAFRFIEDLCRKQGLHTIRLTVNRYNTHAIEVYRHRGFKQVEQRATPIGQGFVMDDFILEKNLSDDL